MKKFTPLNVFSIMRKMKTFLIILIIILEACLKVSKSPFDVSSPAGLSFALLGGSSSTSSSGTGTTTSSGSNASGILALPTISYNASPYSYTAATTVNITPTISSTISNCTVTPSLPSGLALSPTTCIISGSTTVGTFLTSYTITATNASGSATTTISIKGHGTNALYVYGQGGSFTTNSVNGGVGVCASVLNNALDIAFDASQNIYVSDYANNRALYYPAGNVLVTGDFATGLYGQIGIYTNSAINAGGSPTSQTLYYPKGVVVDSSGGLYIADYHNNRVLYYTSGSTTASRVYGQGGSFITNTTGTSATALNLPIGLALDSSGNLYVSDSGNNRVLYFPAGTTTATRVYGQGGSGTNFTASSATVSATGLSGPAGLALDSSGNLYVADYNNSRVLFFPSGSVTATRVYGQAGSFTTNTINNGGVSANSLESPYGLLLDPSGNLYVSDYMNHRVLFYPVGTTTATRVYGQADTFTANTYNNGGISAKSLQYPAGMVLDSNSFLYVMDSGNNRMLVY